MSDQRFSDVSRRKVLRMSAMGAGTATMGFAISGTARRGSGGGKSGGRGQTSDLVELDRPFEVRFLETFETNASCNSDRSAQQGYNRYEFRYCDESDWDKTICVIPDDSDVNEDRVYEFRSAQDCKAPSSEFQTRFSFGPSNSEHSC